MNVVIRKKKKNMSIAAEATKWLAQCAQGREEAALLIATMVATANPLLLRSKLASLGDVKTDGVANGFCQEIAERLIRASAIHRPRTAAKPR